MDAFMNALIKMSLRGVVIILVVMFVRLLLKKFRIDHKYILGLWAMAFLYFIIPWKLSLSVGFWNNANIVNLAGIADNTMVNTPAAPVADEKDIAGTASAIPAEPTRQNIAE